MNPPLTTALRLARHPVNDIDRLNLGFVMIPHLQPGENVDTGALRVLADEVERLRVLLDGLGTGKLDSPLKVERDGLAAQLQACRVDLASAIQTAADRFIDVKRLTGQVTRLCSTVDAYKASGRALEKQVAEMEDRIRTDGQFVLDEHVASWTRLRQHLLDGDAGESLVERIEGVMLERNALRADSPAVREIVRLLNAKGMTAVEAAKAINEVFAEVDKLRADHKDAVELVEKLIHENRTLRGPVPRILPGFESFTGPDLLRIRVEDLTAERDALRAENGRQAATIAALRGADKVRIETPHTGRDDKALFRDWMESQPGGVPPVAYVRLVGHAIDPASPHP